MASTGSIATRISLDGADQVKQQLADISKAGEDALTKLKSAAPSANFDGLSKSIDKVNTSGKTLVTTAGGISGVFATIGPSAQTLSAAMQGLGGSLAEIATRFGGLSTFTLAGVAAGLVAIAQSSISAAVEMNKAAQAAGVSFEKYQVLAQAARESGLEQEKLNVALRKFTQQIDTQGQQQFKDFIDATKQLIGTLGGGSTIKFINIADFDKIKAAAADLAPKIKATLDSINDPRANQSLQQIAALIEKAAQSSEEFRKKLAAIGIATPAQGALEALDKLVEKSKGDLAALGITLIDLNGKIKTPEQAFIEFIDKVSQLPTAADRATAVIKIFGRQAGPELAALISKGVGNIDAIAKKMKELKIGFNEEDLQKAKDAKKSFLELDQSLTQLKNDLGIAFAPVLTLIFKAISNVVNQVRSFIAADIEFLKNAWGVISAAANVVWEEIKSGFSGVRAAFADTWALIASNALAAWEIVKQSASAALAFIAGLFTGGTGNALSAVWEALKTSATVAWDFVKQTTSEGVAAIVTFLTGLPGQIAGALSGLADSITAPFKTAFDGAIALAQSAWDRIKNIFGQSLPTPGAGGSGDSGPALARGGMVFGPGSSTSDSILARLSRGEFVIRAAAVDHFGPSFFAALNNMRMPRFNLGGLVDNLSNSLSHLMPVPGFASGGLVPAAAGGGNMSHATFILDGQQFHFQAEHRVVDAFQRAAVLKGVVSLGRRQGAVK